MIINHNINNTQFNIFYDNEKFIRRIHPDYIEWILIRENVSYNIRFNLGFNYTFDRMEKLFQIEYINYIREEKLKRILYG